MLRFAFRARPAVLPYIVGVVAWMFAVGALVLCLGPRSDAQTKATNAVDIKLPGRATVKSETLIVYRDMSQTSGTVKTLKKGDALVYGFEIQMEQRRLVQDPGSRIEPVAWIRGLHATDTRQAARISRVRRRSSYGVGVRESERRRRHGRDKGNYSPRAGFYVAGFIRKHGHVEQSKGTPGAAGFLGELVPAMPGGDAGAGKIVPGVCRARAGGDWG